ncbi:MAG: glycoside hydrolase family 15 protein [Myxococcota bacterium]
MDIYTASRRISQTHTLCGNTLGIGQYGVIGEGNTCALVGIDGSIDWLCLPTFDSPSAFGAILDETKGGRFRVCPAARGYESLQAYDDATNVLQTLFRVHGKGSVVLTDYMPWNGDPRSSVNELHRMLECRDGELEIDVTFDPRFDYARGETKIEFCDEGLIAEGHDGERLTLSVSGDVRFSPRPEGGVSAQVSVRAGQRLWLILSWQSRRPEKIAAHRPFDHLRATRRYWRGWAGRMEYDGPWRHDVLRSALVLKLLQYAPSGAMVAAPTTSLPVVPGGERNWDYRFSWIRDSAMAVRAMNLIGYPEEAVDFFRFVRDTIVKRDRLDLMVTIHGESIPDEALLPHLSGHMGAHPVRVGNEAREQIQLDIIGPLLDAAYLHEQSGGSVSLAFWQELRKLVNRVVEHADTADHGIWEPRGERAHNVHSKLMIWVALDRALALAPLFGGDRYEKTWFAARDRLAAQILDRGYDRRTGTFTGRYGEAGVDATLLLLPIYGLLHPTDPRIERTTKRVIAELSAGRFIRRYVGDDGIGVDEGAFVLCGFWLSEALALTGRLDEALEVFDNHLSAANHLGLLAEEVDPATAAHLGNSPQAFSHLGLIQAASRLDLALRLRDEGISDPPYLPSDFPHIR